MGLIVGKGRCGCLPWPCGLHDEWVLGQDKEYLVVEVGNAEREWGVGMQIGKEL